MKNSDLVILQIWKYKQAIIIIFSKFYIVLQKSAFIVQIFL